jgi:uncharacterized protein
LHKHHLAGALALALALPATAQAHVTLQPKQAPAGGFVVEDVRVPNERDNANTTKVDLQMPPGFASVSYQATPGWSVKVTKEKLATPIKTDDGEVTEEVRRITWTATSKAAAIGPGQFRDFPLSVQVPGKAGDKLTFKALQTYSNGEIVRWIGAPSSDTPAPQVTLTAGQDAGNGAAAQKTAATQPVAATSTGNKASKGLGIAALVVAVAGALMAAAALVRRRA